MNDLSHIQDRIVDYVYGELDASGLRDVERHVASCAKCAEELAKVQGVRRAAMALPQVQPRAEITEVILRRGRELAPSATRKPSLWSWFLRPVWGTAFLFAVTLGAGLYIARTGSHDGGREELPSASRFVPPAPTVVAAPAAPPAAEPPRGSAPDTTSLALLARGGGGAEGENRKGDVAKAPRPERAAAPSPLVPSDAESPRIIAQVARPAKEALFPQGAPAEQAVAKPSEAPAAEAKPQRPADEPAHRVARKAKKERARAEGELAFGFDERANPKAEEQRVARLLDPYGGNAGAVGWFQIPKDKDATAPVSGVGGLRNAEKTPAADDLSAKSAARDEAPARTPPMIAVATPPPKPSPQAYSPAQPAAPMAAPQASAPAPTAAVPAGPALAYGTSTGGEAERDERSLSQRRTLVAEERPRSAATSAPRAYAPTTSSSLRESAPRAEPSSGERAQADGLLARAESEYSRGDVAATVATLELLFRRSPDYPVARAYELLATAYERRGDTARASAVRARARSRTLSR